MTRILTFMVALLPVAAFAQDTQTEKEAARDVLKKMAALEQSLDVPGLVARLTAPNADRDQIVARVKELMDKELLTMGDDIATHPEIGFEEKRSVSKLTDYLRQHNFSVETGSGGLSTAFVAKFRQNNGSAARKGRFTATSTARRVRSGWRRQSRSPSTSRERKRPAASSSTARLARR